MAIILSKWIVDFKEQHSIYIIKEIDTQQIPIAGASVQDAAWRNPQIPTHISCDFEQGHYFLNFTTEKVSSADELNQIVALYQTHGWKEGLDQLFD